jgi:hypothetical protein
MRRLVRLVALLVAVGATVWALRLLFVGGIRVVLAGHLIRSTDPWRPFEWAFGASIVFVLTGGIPLVRQAWGRVRRVGNLVPVVGGFLTARGSALAVAAALVGTGVAYMSTVASGADGSGYVSEADRFLHGPLKPPQPWVGEVPWPNPRWTFSPLGYRPVEDTPPYAQAPTYAPGLPLLMAGAKLLGGQAGLFLVVPISAGILVLSTFGIGRRLRGPPCGLMAAWLVATSPIVLVMLVFPMSDLPVAAAWTTAVWCLLGAGPVSAIGAGLCAALAITIRPNLVFLAALMSLWYLLRVDGPGWAIRRRARDLVLFSAGVLPGPLFIAALFSYLYGSPFESGYGGFADMLELKNVPVNLQLYFGWAMGAQGLFTVAGLVGLLVPWVWPAGNARRAMGLFAAMFLAITAEYVFYQVFSDWSFLRFFLPAWPLLAIGAAGVATVVYDRLPEAARWTVVAGLIAVGGIGVQTARERYAFDLWHGNRRYTAAAVLIQSIAPPNSLIFTMEHSGSVRYYSGFIPLRFDELPEDWLDRSLDWLASQGVHCYAVLDEWELPKIRERFKDQHDLHTLDTPIVIYQAYRQGAQVYIYDLSRPPIPGTHPQIVSETNPGRWRNWPAGPTPTLVFHRLAGQ